MTQFAYYANRRGFQVTDAAGRHAELLLQRLPQPHGLHRRARPDHLLRLRQRRERHPAAQSRRHDARPTPGLQRPEDRRTPTPTGRPNPTSTIRHGNVVPTATSRSSPTALGEVTDVHLHRLTATSTHCHAQSDGAHPLDGAVTTYRLPHRRQPCHGDRRPRQRARTYAYPGRPRITAPTAASRVDDCANAGTTGYTTWYAYNAAGQVDTQYDLPVQRRRQPPPSIPRRPARYAADVTYADLELRSTPAISLSSTAGNGYDSSGNR